MSSTQTKTRSKDLRSFAMTYGLFVLAFGCPVISAASENAPYLLVPTDGNLAESVLEAFLSPQEFADRRFEYESAGDEASFAVDASLSASPPVIELHPERIQWPQIASASLSIEGKTLALTPMPGLTDEALDAGFKIKWIVKALGQRFAPKPSFAAEVVQASIVSPKGNTVLATWHAKQTPAVCRPGGLSDTPKCRLPIGFEVRAISVSPDASELSLAFGGLRPRIEVYDIKREPLMIWQAIFPRESGGIVETAFSTDGQWVTALTAEGVMHRFDAATGGLHLTVPSSGLTALAVPPGRMMAVAGKGGEITVWYLADGTVAKKFPPRNTRGTVDRLAASGNGEVIGTVEYGETETVVRMWDLESRNLRLQFSKPGRTLASIAIDDTGNTYFVSDENEGLLIGAVDSKQGPKPVTGDSAARCTGRIEWVPKKKALFCSVKDGLVQLDRNGKIMKALKIDEATTDWVTAASPSGERIAVAGGGRLFIWWME